MTPSTLTPKSPDIARHLVPKAIIVRCPSCGSANVRIGLTTRWGTPVFCLDEEKMYPTRREG